jgi:hypothetical protein
VRTTVGRHRQLLIHQGAEPDVVGASASTATSPAADTSLGSSNSADARESVWQSCACWMPCVVMQNLTVASQILPPRKGILRIAFGDLVE